MLIETNNRNAKPRPVNLPGLFKPCQARQALVSLICALFLSVGGVNAQDAETRPVFSERYETEDVLSAHVEVKSRWDQSQEEQAKRFSEFDGVLDDFVRTDPILQDVTWDYGACSDVISLIPPPLEGWGLRSEASYVEIPVSEERAQVHYVRYDPALGSGDDTFYQSERSVALNISISPDNEQFFEMMLGQQGMRDVLFDAGPYNYPLMKGTNRTQLGPYMIEVSATDPEDATAYLTRVIACGVKGGLLAPGLDPTTLRGDP